MRGVKLAIVHNIIAPYRHPLFEKLFHCFDLTVYYCSVKSGLRSWDLWPRRYDYKYKVLWRMPIGEFSLNPPIVREIALNRPNVLVLGGYIDPTMWVAFVLGKLLKISVIYWTEGVKEPQSILGTMTRPLRTLFIRKSSAVVVPGRLSRDYVISLGANEEKVFIAPNAIDNELFVKKSRKHKSHKKKLKCQHGLNSKLVILCVAQLIKRKGIEYLFCAYRTLEQERDDIALVIIGSGPLEHDLKDLASSLRLKNLKIINSGLSLDELIKFYSIADIFVLPTLEDVWGFVVNEAMSCGLPLVATQASQAAVEMIRPEENGFLIRKGNVQEIYGALKKLVGNPDLRHNMAKKSRELVMDNFDPEHMVRGFLSAVSYCRSIPK